MKLQNRDITLGASVVVKCVSPRGTIQWKPAQIVDINEHMKAVKLLVFKKFKEEKIGKTQWIALSEVMWEAPKDEEVKL